MAESAGSLEVGSAGRGGPPPSYRLTLEVSDDVLDAELREEGHNGQ